MNLVKFLLIGGILSTILGEFGQVPFGSSAALSVTDLLIFLSLLFFIIWSVVVRRKIIIPKFFYFLIAFWGIGIFSLVFSLALFPVVEVLKGSLYLIKFIIYSSVLLVVYNLIKDKILKTEELINYFLVVGVILAVLGFIQLILFPDLEPLTTFGFDPHKGRLTSTFLDPNFLGVYLNLTLGLLIFKFLKQKSFLFGSLIFVTILGIILTYSRSAYLMLGVFIFCLFVILGRKLNLKQRLGVLLVFLILLGGILITFPRFYERIIGGLTIDKSASERVLSWKNSLEIFNINPVFGVGFNNYRITQEELNLFKTYSVDGGHAGSGVDSSFLLVLATTGILGFLAFIGFWIFILEKLYIKNTTLSLIFFSLFISLLVSTQFINSLFFAPILLSYFSFMGLFGEDR